MNKAAVFDFNGTMFFDDIKQEQSWYKFAKDEFNRDISIDEFNLHIHGFSNHEILPYLSNKQYSKKEVLYYATKKELVYQKMCEDDKKNLKLVDGLEDFLSLLKNNGIRLSICTSSMKPNVDWYYKIFKLDRFFNYDDIIYDDGNIKKGKPDPEIYLKAFKHLNVPCNDIIVFEDSFSGLKSAKEAGCGMLVKIGDKKLNIEYDVEMSNFKNIDNKIKQFLNI